VASASRCGVQKWRKRSNQASTSPSGWDSTWYRRRVPAGWTDAKLDSRRTLKWCETAGWEIAELGLDDGAHGVL
jgi:hypothetical protein